MVLLAHYQPKVSDPTTRQQKRYNANFLVQPGSRKAQTRYLMRSSRFPAQRGFSASLSSRQQRSPNQFTCLFRVSTAAARHIQCYVFRFSGHQGWHKPSRFPAQRGFSASLSSRQQRSPNQFTCLFRVSTAAARHIQCYVFRFSGHQGWHKPNGTNESTAAVHKRIFWSTKKLRKINQLATEISKPVFSAKQSSILQSHWLCEQPRDFKFKDNWIKRIRGKWVNTKLAPYIFILETMSIWMKFFSQVSATSVNKLLTMRKVRPQQLKKNKCNRNFCFYMCLLNLIVPNST